MIDADRPWALLIARGRAAARAAVTAEAKVGITARDPVTHRVRIAELKTVQVSSYDTLTDRIETRPDPRPA